MALFNGSLALIFAAYNINHYPFISYHSRQKIYFYYVCSLYICVYLVYSFGYRELLTHLKHYSFNCFSIPWMPISPTHIDLWKTIGINLERYMKKNSTRTRLIQLDCNSRLVKTWKEKAQNEKRNITQR